jgi:hypothetical protein
VVHPKKSETGYGQIVETMPFGQIGKLHTVTIRRPDPFSRDHFLDGDGQDPTDLLLEFLTELCQGFIGQVGGRLRGRRIGDYDKPGLKRLLIGFQQGLRFGILIQGNIVDNAAWRNGGGAGPKQQRR